MMYGQSIWGRFLDTVVIVGFPIVVVGVPLAIVGGLIWWLL